MTFTAGQKVRASQLNLLDVLASGKQSFTDNNETTASTTYADLTTAGPSVTITSLGTVAIVYLESNCRSSSGSALVGVDVSGAITISAATNETNGLNADSTSLSTSQNTPARVLGIVTITPGTNTFKMRYRVSAGTGTFRHRRIVVLAP